MYKMLSLCIAIICCSILLVQCDNRTQLPSIAKVQLMESKKETVSIADIRTSTPMQIYECLCDFPVMRCAKLFLLQNMEAENQYIHTGNLTRDFLNQFLISKKHNVNSLVSERFNAMTDAQLDSQLINRLQKFFKNRYIQLQFLPDLIVKIQPDPNNELKFSINQKSKSNIDGRGNDDFMSFLNDAASNLFNSDDEPTNKVASTDDGKLKSKDSKKKVKKDKSKNTILEMAVPVMLMPAILMGTFLPFWLPVLKMATFTTLLMNNAAFISALIYAARTHVNSQEQHNINYNYDHSSVH